MNQIMCYVLLAGFILALLISLLYGIYVYRKVAKFFKKKAVYTRKMYECASEENKQYWHDFNDAYENLVQISSRYIPLTSNVACPILKARLLEYVNLNCEVKSIRWEISSEIRRMFPYYI